MRVGGRVMKCNRAGNSLLCTSHPLPVAPIDSELSQKSSDLQFNGGNNEVSKQMRRSPLGVPQIFRTTCKLRKVSTNL